MIKPGPCNARYAHISHDTKVQIEITAKEMEAILFAYDYGIANIDEESISTLDKFMDKIKYEIWP